MDKKTIAIMFGGMSPEHEVSVISGLQILKNIDNDKYNPLALFIDKKGLIWILPKYKKESDFLNSPRKLVVFGKDENGGFLMYRTFPLQKIHIDCAYLTLHGGTGEMGIIQGLLESYSIPHSSPNVESSVLCMNKQVSKILVEQKGVPTVPGISLLSSEIKKDIDNVIKEVLNRIGLPLIVKPVHLGSSIGLSICKSEIELKKGLLSSALLDDEILIEKFMPDISEFNISVSVANGEMVFSAIERPLKSDEILSFKDKYEKGGKGKMNGGMASLSRELPAQISKDLEDELIRYSEIVYSTLKCKGQVRIDYIYSENKLYFSEINPIPGSLAFYLWEATGESFKDQITRVLEESMNNKGIDQQFTFDYTSDIVEKYIKATSNKDL